MANEGPIATVAGWPVVSFADITTKIGSGATPRGGAGTYLGSRKTFALIRSQNVFDRHFSHDGLAFISDEQAAGLGGVRLQSGDVLLNITGDGVTFGRACMVPDDVLPACVNQHVAIVRAQPDEADPRYILAFLTHPDVKPYIASFNSGGSRRAVTKGHIESFKLSLPPLSVQRGIAATLGAIDDKIESNRRKRYLLRSLGAAHLQAAVLDEGTESRPLGELVRSIARGVTPRYADGDPSAALVLNQRCIRDGWATTTHARHMSPKAVALDKRVSSGDMLVNSTGVGTLGRVGRWHSGEIYADSHVSIVKPDPYALGPTVLAYSLFGRESEIETMATGSTGQTELSPSRLAELAIQVPSGDVMARLEMDLWDFEQNIDSLFREEASLASLRDILLPELLSGRRRALAAAVEVGMVTV